MSEESQQAFAIAADNLGAYAALMWPGFELYKHNVELIRFLHRVERGEITRGIITMPPRHGKSLITSNLFQSWYLGRHPEHFIVGASHTDDLAKDFSGYVRDNIDPTKNQGKIHTSIFPNSKLRQGSASKTDFFTTMGGRYRGIGRGGNITGRGANIITIDDPFKGRTDADSETVREAVKRWYKSEIYTRLQPIGGAILIISTRYHQDDLIGYVLREHAHEGWVELDFPAIAEKDEEWRSKGEALWPERFPVERLQQIRLTLGNSEFMPQYQGRPGAEDGIIFKSEWLRRCYLPRPLEKDHIEKMNKVILVDPGGSKKKSDFTAMWVIGLSGDQNYYVLDLVRDKLGLHQRCEILMDLHMRWFPVDKVIYESIGIQSDREHIEYVMARKNRFFYIEDIGGKLPKVDRIKKLEPLFRAGRIKLPKTIPYTPLADDLPREVDLIRQFVEEEYKTFPSCLHDDCLDALARLVDEKAQLDWPDPVRPPEEPKRRRWAERAPPVDQGDWMTS